MLNKAWKVGVAFALSSVMMVGTSVGAFASSLPQEKIITEIETTITTPTVTPIVNETINAAPGNDNVEIQGKAKVASAAIKALSKFVKNNSDTIRDLLPGDKLKDAWDEASWNITNELDFLASLGDAVEDQVQNAIVQAIMGVAQGSISSSVANRIANVVMLFL
ncbi:hypothetical protein MKX75_01015 [Paenibacillus sp. FSL R5-0341]|uniref:hypothetical protein n=1 Tax=Paenibacillus sp. FSL R5-0341 TaxID=2921636 RepID=UPI0030D2E04A